MSFYKDLRMSAAGETAQPTPAPTTDSNQLNPQEIASLLEILKRATFMGEQVEVVYNMVLKLQNQYTQQVDKK